MLSESTTFHQRDFSHKYIETHIYIFCYRNTFFVEYVLVVVVYDKKGWCLWPKTRSTKIKFGHKLSWNTIYNTNGSDNEKFLSTSVDSCLKLTQNIPWYYSVKQNSLEYYLPKSNTSMKTEDTYGYYSLNM